MQKPPAHEGQAAGMSEDGCECHWTRIASSCIVEDDWRLFTGPVLKPNMRFARRTAHDVVVSHDPPSRTVSVKEIADRVRIILKIKQTVVSEISNV